MKPLGPLQQVHRCQPLTLHALAGFHVGSTLCVCPDLLLLQGKWEMQGAAVIVLSHPAAAQCHLGDQHEPSVSASLARLGEPAGQAVCRGRGRERDHYCGSRFK